MKKLLATLVLSLGVTAVAQAQSSVTVYGILDVGYTSRNLKGSPSTATNTLTQNTIGSSYETPSRLGFRGVEDLGGGTSTFFTIETAIVPTGATASTFFNRQTFVGISQRGLGRAQVGTQFGPIFKAVLMTDPADLVNSIGSVIYPGGSGPNGATNTADAAFTIRFNNAAGFETERFSGFRANGIYAINNQNSTKTGATTGGEVNSGAYGLGIDYVKGNFTGAVAYQKVNSTDNTVSTASISSTFVGTNTTDSQLYAGASYDLKIVKLFAGYTDRKVQSNLNPSEQLNRTGQQIGVRGYITKQIESWASVGNGRYSAYGVGTPTANFTAYQVGSNYWMSKRTNLYLVAGSTQTSSTSTTGALSGNQVSTGIRHTF